jgi:GTP-binding protein
LIDEELEAALSAELPKDLPHVFISSHTNYHLKELKDMLWKALN